MNVYANSKVNLCYWNLKKNTYSTDNKIVFDQLTHKIHYGIHSVCTYPTAGSDNLSETELFSCAVTRPLWRGLFFLFLSLNKNLLMYMEN